MFSLSYLKLFDMLVLDAHLKRPFLAFIMVTGKKVKRRLSGASSTLNVLMYGSTYWADFALNKFRRLGFLVWVGSLAWIQVEGISHFSYCPLRSTLNSMVSALAKLCRNMHNEIS